MAWQSLSGKQRPVSVFRLGLAALLLASLFWGSAGSRTGAAPWSGARPAATPRSGAHARAVRPRKPAPGANGRAARHGTGAKTHPNTAPPTGINGDLLAAIPPVDEHRLDSGAAGIAAATMVLDFYRRPQTAGLPGLTLQAVSRYVREWDWAPGLAAGVTVDGLRKGIEQASRAPSSRLPLPLDALWHQTASGSWLARLRDQLAAGHPVIVYIANGGLLWFALAGSGHFLVVSGISADNSIRFHDPWDGRTHSLSTHDFAGLWGASLNGNPPWWYLTVVPNPIAAAQATAVALRTAVAREQATAAARKAAPRGTPTPQPRSTKPGSGNGHQKTPHGHAATGTPTRPGPKRPRAHPTATPHPSATPRPTATPVPHGLSVRYISVPPPIFSAAGANLRDAPSAGGNVKMVILDGQPVVATLPPVIGADGKPWYAVTYQGLSGYVLGTLLSPLAPPAGPVFAELPFPTGSSQPGRILRAADGYFWVPEEKVHAIARISNETGFTEYPLPAGAGYPAGIAMGPDGNLWFTEPSAGKIGRVNGDGTVSDFTAPDPGSNPYSLATGPDGTLWYTSTKDNTIVHIDADGTTNVFNVPAPKKDLQHITAGPDGNMWFTEGTGNAIGQITPNGQVTEFPVPSPDSEPWDIAAGSDGNLWFTAFKSNQIGRITPQGNITMFDVPTAASNLNHITPGVDGNMWFTEGDGNKIGRITPDGQITEWEVPTPNSAPFGIFVDPQGTVWFTEENANQLGQLYFRGPAQVPALPTAIPSPTSIPTSTAIPSPTANPGGNPLGIPTVTPTPVSAVPTATPSPAVTAGGPSRT